MEVPMVSKEVKYIIAGVIFVAITFFIGRCSKPDVDISLWEVEKRDILYKEMQKQDSLMILMSKREKRIVLLEKKDSVYLEVQDQLHNSDAREIRNLKSTIGELRKISTSALQDTILYEYEKYYQRNTDKF